MAPGAAQEGVAAFVESFRGRMLLPIDDPPDRLYGLITHELTHSFENDIIPQGLIGRSVPLWVMEGLADYMRGDWVPLEDRSKCLTCTYVDVDGPTEFNGQLPQFAITAETRTSPWVNNRPLDWTAPDQHALVAAVAARL